MMRILLFVCFLFCNTYGYAKAEPTIEICKKKFSEVIRKHKSWREATAAWDMHKDDCPKDGAFEKYYASIYGHENMLQEGLDYLKSSAKNYNKTPKRILFALAEVHSLMGNQEKSLALTNELIAKYPNWEGGYRLLGIYEGEKGHHEKAREYFELAIEEKEEGFNAWNYMCLVEENYFLKDYNKAAISFAVADNLDARVAFMSKRMTSYGAIALLKESGPEDCKYVLQQQAKYDPAATELPAYKEAVALYEKTTGKRLNYKKL